MKKKTTKGLKKELKPRKKTMPQDPTMYNFGKLGTHSETALINDIRIGDPFIVSKDESKTINNYRVYFIEILHDIHKRSIERRIGKLINKRYFFPRLYAIVCDTKEVEVLYKRLNILQLDYNKYKSVIERLSKKKCSK